jgi:DNA-binding Lrp family transcriptional regulator
MKEKIIKQIKKGKMINTANKEVNEIIMRLIDDGLITGYDPKFNKKIKYRWIE